MGKRGTTGPPRKATRGAASSRQGKKTPHRNERSKAVRKSTKAAARADQAQPARRERTPVEPPEAVVVPAVEPVDEPVVDAAPQSIPLPEVIVVPAESHGDASPPPEAEPIADPPAPAIDEVVPAPTVPQEPPVQAGGPTMADHARDEAAPEPLLFEIGWEVCWQLGGIYTVLKSKIVAMQKQWGDRYTLIGPYNPSTAAVEFEETEPEGPCRRAIQELRDQGMGVHYGRWLVPGRPRVILLDYRNRYQWLDNDKYLLWKDHGIHTYAADGETNEVVAFGFSVTELLRLMTEHHAGRPILAHFHEWMAGVAVPRIAHLRLPISTVFTTHATLLGRYIAGENPHFYDHLPFLNAEAEAQRFNILPRFQIERAAAHASTVFTTISEVTAAECEYLLGRTVDRLLPNGLNIKKFAAPHEFQALHSKYKERIHEFVTGHFFPAYTFDLDKTLYVFTSGRYEYRNKGMDLFIEALFRVNERLRDVPDRPTIVAFIVTRAPTRQLNINVIQNHAMFEDLRTTCQELQERIGRRLFQSVVQGKIPHFDDLVDDEGMLRLRQSMHAFRNHRQPTIVTHDLQDDQNDPVLRHLRHRGLLNHQEDPVKVIFHPEFVTHTSPLFHMDYDNFVRGCHMGVFPSYYEPWGYTPMETMALGLPSVTTDLSGFGAYVNRHIIDNDSQGVRVLDRRYRSFEDAVERLTDHLMRFATYNRRQRIEFRNKVERLSQMFDWSELISRYHDAHALALDRWAAATTAGRFELRLV